MGCFGGILCTFGFIWDIFRIYFVVFFGWGQNFGWSKFLEDKIFKGSKFMVSRNIVFPILESIIFPNIYILKKYVVPTHHHR